MQDAGSLKKRRKRILSKVIGLGTKIYEEKDDHFDIHLIYSHLKDSGDNHSASSISLDDEAGSRNASASAGYSRPTRKPWNPPPTGDNLNNTEQGLNKPSTAAPTQGVGSYSKSKEERPCLISKKAVRRLQQVCVVGSLVWALPWRWNPKTQQVDRWSPGVHRVWQIFWFIFAFQNACLLQFQFYSFFGRVEKDNGSYRVVFMNSFSVFWYLYSVSLNTCMHIYRERFRVYINSILLMNRTYINRYVIHLDNLEEQGQAILSCAVPFNFVQLLLSCSVFIFMPYQPWFLYSYIYTPENPFYWQIPGFLQEWVMAGQTVAVFNLLAWLSVTHGNSVEFWLAEAHNKNQTAYTTEEIREPHKTVELYRSLQIVTGLLNECISPMAFPIMKIVNWTTVVVCGYILIRSMNEKFIQEFPAIMFYPFGLIICCCCGYGMLHSSAEMFDIATSFLDNWSQTKHRDFRRILLSCATLRIYIGRWYYVTNSTTITYFQKIFDYIIDFIVTFP